MPRKQKTIDLSQVWGGVNLADDPASLRPNQVQYSLGAMLLEGGPRRYPGVRGINSSQSAAGWPDAYIYGLHIYRNISATEYLLAVCNNQVYSVNKTTEAITAVGSAMGSGGNAYFKNVLGTCFVINGAASAGDQKIEDGNGYPIGIDAPTSCTTGLVSGGTLPDGAYQIYAGYARKSGSTTLLLSRGVVGTTRTCGSGNNTIRVTIPTPSDSQVTHKVVWFTDAAGSTWYFYGETAVANAYIDITSNADRDTDRVYSTDAADNYTPRDIGGFRFLEYHDNRLWGAGVTSKNIVYYSNKHGTKYKLEEFPAAYKYTLPYEILGIYSIGEHLYFSTVAGMIRLPYGDPLQEIQFVYENKFFFLYPNAVRNWKGAAVGLTNHGIRFFDGINWGDDLSHNIKEEVLKTLNATAPHQPCIEIMRRNERAELHFCFMDTTVNTVNNNKRWILNLDKINDAENSIYCWELQKPAADYMVVDGSDVLYSAQTITPGGGGTKYNKIYKEWSGHTADIYFYDGETYNTSIQLKELTIKYRRVIPSIQGRSWFWKANTLAEYNKEITLTVYIDDRAGTSSEQSIGGLATVARFGIARFGISRFSSRSLTKRETKLPMNLKGYSMHAELTQTSDDGGFKVLALGIEDIISFNNLA